MEKLMKQSILVNSLLSFLSPLMLLNEDNDNRHLIKFSGQICISNFWRQYPSNNISKV